MADITYQVVEISSEEIPGFEQYSEDDKGLLNSFEINNLFDPSKNHIELGIFDLSDNLLEYDQDYKSYYQLENAQSAGRSGASILTVDPVKDSITYGYDLGGVVLLYHLLNDLYTVNNSTTEFFIESISEDRTELRLLAVSLTDNEIVNLTAQIKSNLETESYYSDFRLNFKNNDLFIGINIDTVDINQGKAVVVKLYEPLPDNYSEKDRLSIVDVVSDSVSYNIESRITTTLPIQPTLRSPNFNLEISDENTVPTGYLNYNELFSYPVENANSEIYSLFNEKGVDVSIDFTDYSDFVHFSSAEERLNNLKYKIDLISDYSASLSSIQTGALGSRAYFENLITGIISNFDHYERFVYYESGSSSWPKSNNTKPYINIPSIDPSTATIDPVITAWYTSQLTEAIAFDRTNGNSLVNAIPSYLKDDNNNVNYLTFIYMIGQHFDNLWTYARAVTDKYDGDNRMNHGISKDLVGEALRNFGVKLYTSNKSIEDLFASLIGQSYQSGSEYITDYIESYPTGSTIPTEPSSLDNYQKEIQKRIYHNLPLLLKSKGTERGLRALINCFGIPSDILKIKYFGGIDVSDRPFFGDYSYYTSSLDKIRLDNTGSLIPGDTLSGNTSNIKRNLKYTDDLHNIEVGFSPSDNIDNYIISQSAATFNIDDYIGDPRSLTLPDYQGLYPVAEAILSNLDRYNLQDYVRLIKFFDNVIFKMVKDFVPGRVVADTGVVIRPNLLNRSKARSVKAEGTRPEHSGSVNTAFIESTDGGVYQTGSIQINTAYSRFVKTPEGTLLKQDHSQEEAKYDGELKDSIITITNGELGKNNPYINPIYPTTYFDINIFYIPPVGLCIIKAKPPGVALPNSAVNLANYFTNTTQDTIFKIGSSLTTLQIVPNPSNYTITGQIGEAFIIQVEDPNATNSCIITNTVTLEICSISFKDPLPELIQPGQTITFEDYIDNPGGISDIDYYIDNILQNGTTYTVLATAITQGQSTFTLKVQSNNGGCIRQKVFNISSVSVAISNLSIYVTVALTNVVVTNLNTNTAISERGICWNTSPNPTTSNFKKITNQSQGTTFTSVLESLTPDTTYYFRAYAITPLGTIYSTARQEKTLKLGLVTLTGTLTPSQYITFTSTTTNPASLPIARDDDNPFELRISNNYNTNVVNLPMGHPYGEEDILPSYTVNKVFNISNSSTIIQPNTTYSFRAITTFQQGVTGLDLNIFSSQATVFTYNAPRLEIGTLLAGGTVYNVLQRGDPGYTGVTKIYILADQNYYALGNIASPGQTTSYSLRTSRGTMVSGTNALGYSDWRIASTADFRLIWTRRDLLPLTYRATLNNREFWAADNDKYYDFDTSTSSTTGGNVKDIDSYSSLKFVRSVRSYSFS